MKISSSIINQVENKIDGLDHRSRILLLLVEGCSSMRDGDLLTHSRLENLIDVKMPTQNLLKLLLLLMLVMRIVLATVCCRFGSWGLVIKLNFCSDFEHFGQDFLKLKFWRDFEAEVWSAFCRWCFEEVTKLNLGQYSEARFGQDFNFRLSWDADVWLKIWSWCLIDIL